MINLIAASNIAPLGNQAMEMEYMVSRKLLGYNYQDDFIHTKWLLSSLPIISLLGETSYTKEMEKLRDLMVSSTSELLNDLEVKELFEGKGLGLRYLKSLIKKTEIFLPILALEAASHQLQDFEHKINSFEGLDQYETAILVDNMPQDSEHEINKLIGAMNEFIIKGKGILELTPNKLPPYRKTSVPENLKDIPLWLNSLSFELMVTENSTPGYVVLLGTVINSLQTTLPKNKLDPFEEDQFMNGLEVLREPKRYFKMLKNYEILSPQVAQGFSMLYPEFHMYIMNLSINDMTSEDNQEAINAKASCAIPSDDSELLNLCTQAIYKGYTEQ